MAGKLLILEGTDASGKSTQFEMLCARLSREGREFRTVAFPRYQEESSALVRLYLDGAFGSDPADVNAYAASTFFAVDRYASYKTDWGEYYRSGGTMLLDRYTTSNAVHQASKLPEAEREGFCRWLFDFEYRLLGLPEPDAVFYLDMPVFFAAELLKSRKGKQIDIHEHDLGYLEQCRETGLQVAGLFGWRCISCADGDHIKSREAIHEELYRRVCAALDAPGPGGSNDRG